MPKIFISYRRADTSDFTQLFYVLMSRHFDEIFIDVDDIPVGVDFRKYFADEIAKVDVVLVVIGQQWGDMMRQRASQANDFVRIEIESAIQQRKLVIPVLVMDAEMPDFGTLPTSIETLQWINASKVRELPDMERDCERLAKGIERTLHHNTQRIKLNMPPRPDKSILPDPFEWIHIPAGNVTLEEGGYVPEGGQTFHVDDFYIAKYPITNAQYAVYVKETAKNPAYWDDEKFNQPLQPVVGISWDDSIAYCQWLSQKLDYDVTLPTEQEWQRAAQGDDSRAYPWGNQWEWDKNKTNTVESQILKTTPVNQYPQGASPYRVMDMSGNVLEWCLTAWKTGSNAVNDTNNRIVRGGSWLFIMFKARSVSRYYFFPIPRLNYLFGFRVCVAPVDSIE